MFREPATKRYLKSLAMDSDRAVECWTLMYRHVLERHRTAGSWLFVHFDQVLSGDYLDRVAARTGAKLDRSFPEPGLRRSGPGAEMPPGARRVYETLCELAGFETLARNWGKRPGDFELNVSSPSPPLVIPAKAGIQIESETLKISIV